ncbi:YaaC family protein [Brevibacillus laterosporus]|uniref:YaaC family protein n=1 Tax=Brevibacillus TaxID=55080 RepID=UPI0037BECB95
MFLRFHKNIIYKSEYSENKGVIFSMSLQDVWQQLSIMETEPTSRSFLTASYHRMGLQNPEKHAFQNSTRFLYTWMQARHYYEMAAKSSLLIKPLLLFYGCVHLLKGLILAKDPDYPQNSRMLQHGVTARKVKKNPYHLLDDEMKPQKEGFFPHLCRLLSIHPISDRYRVSDLFLSIPELREEMDHFQKPSPWVAVSIMTERPFVFALPHASQGALSYSDETLQHYLNRLFAATNNQGTSGSFPLFCTLRQNTDKARFTLPSTSSVSNQGRLFECDDRVSLFEHPLFSIDQNRNIYLWNDIDNHPVPQFANHYLLLYGLSMLCRYESELWGDLVLSHQYAEKLLIERFCKHHMGIFPYMVEQQLQLLK